MAARTFAALGSDIALTRYVGTESSLALDDADSWRGLDLAVVPASRGRRRPTADASDLGAVDGRSNLGQALIVRLLTPRGTLGPLGHPEYGSRLVELIGRRNDETARNLARLYTLQAVREEPRVAELLELAVETAPDRPDSIRIDFAVRPVGDDEPLALGLEVAL
jgi:phage baseplate assembly protein W